MQKHRKRYIYITYIWIDIYIWIDTDIDIHRYRYRYVCDLPNNFFEAATQENLRTYRRKSKYKGNLC